MNEKDLTRLKILAALAKFDEPVDIMEAAKLAPDVPPPVFLGDIAFTPSMFRFVDVDHSNRVQINDAGRKELERLRNQATAEHVTNPNEED